MWKAGLDEAQAGIKIAERNINNLRYADDTTLMEESEEELKSLLMKMKKGSEETGLKLSIQKMKIVASGPITSRQLDEGIMEIVTAFIFLGSKITADGDCSHEIKMLAPWKESYDQPRRLIKKQRHYLTDKVLSSQSYGFFSGHVGIWKLDHKESWVPKNWCFWTVVLEETLESPWTARRSVLSVHWKDWCWSWNSNTLATLCEELTHWKSSWCWERLKVGEGDNRGWDGWMASPTQWTWVWASSGSWWWTAKPGVLRSLGLQSQTRQSYWIELNWAMLLQIITNLVAKNYTNLLSYSYGGQRSGLETKMKVSVGLHPMWRL